MSEVECEPVLYLVRARCIACDEIVPLVEERDTPIGLMQDVEITATFCPACGRHRTTDEWDRYEETRVERSVETDAERGGDE